MKSIRNFQKVRQSGMGILPTMLTVAIIALVLLIGSRYYLSKHTPQVTDKINSDVSFLLSSVKTWGDSQTSYKEIKLSTLSDSNLIPEGFEISEETEGLLVPLKEWDGCKSTVSIEADETGDGVMLVFSKLSPAVCNRLIEYMKNQKTSWHTLVTENCLEVACGGTVKVKISKKS